MELSNGQQRLLFVVVVLGLAGLGIYLVGPGSHHGAAASPGASAGSAGPSAAASTVPAIQPATAPATPATAGGGVDIYQWLPFTQQDLAAAARVTLAFAADYDTYSYTETDTAYIGKMAGLITSDLAGSLKNAYDLPGSVSARSAQKQVSTSSGTIVSIRSFGTAPVSIMFVVNITQKLATTKGTSASTTQYWVTVVSGAAGWQVSDIELAGAGNP
ncbi:MAG TPA: hypothetical protein VKV38_14810 [Trebonia sp.]|jgi:hypothetical protein|nr:hypothetical protein [Trebonia sp.]